MTGFVGQIAILSRGVFALVLDGSLVPFFSKCLDACMRANFVFEKFEKGIKF